MKTTKIEFNGLIAVGTIAAVIDISEGCDTVGAKWVHEWEGDPHCMLDLMKARVAAFG